MPKLSHDLFLDPPKREVTSPLGAKKEALYGIGDRDYRAAQDFLWSIGDRDDRPASASASTGASPLTAAWRPAIGDEVEFELRDGLTRIGRVTEVPGRDVIIEIGDGAFNIVPLSHVRPIEAFRRRDRKRAEIRSSLRGLASPLLSETRSAIQIGTGAEVAVTLEYGLSMRPSEEDVRAHLLARYPGSVLVDGDDTHPGKIGCVLRFASHEAAQAAISAPAIRPAPGLGEEEIEGTGRIGEGENTAEEKATVAADAALHALAALYPTYDFVETAREVSADTITAHFEVLTEGRPLFTGPKGVSPILTKGAVPVVGAVHVTPSAPEGFALLYDGKTAKPVSAVMPAYHQDVPLSREGDDEEATPIGGPGLQVADKHEAVDETAKKYWIEYQGDYGRALVAAFDGDRNGVRWATKIVKGFVRYAADLPPEPAFVGEVPSIGGAGAAGADAGAGADFDETLAAELLKSMQAGPEARKAVMDLVTRYLAKVPADLRLDVESSPQAIKKLLPTMLKSMSSTDKRSLASQYAPGMAAKMPGLGERAQETVSRGWEGLKQKFKAPSTRRREKYQRGREIQDVLGPAEPVEPAAPTPAAPTAPAPVRGPVRAPVRRPSAPPSAAPPSAPPSAAPPTPAPNVTLPAGTTVVGPRGPVQVKEDVRVHVPSSSWQRTPQSREPTLVTPQTPVQAQSTPIARSQSPKDAPPAERVIETHPQGEERHRWQPAAGAMRFRAEDMRREGDYVVMTVVWDTSTTEKMAPAAILHQIRRYVVQRASEKESTDLGFIGKPIVDSCDLDIGVAEVRFRSSEARTVVPVVRTQ